MAGADWLNTITITIVLAASPPSRATLTIPLLIVDQASNTLNGSKVVTYLSSAEVAVALTAGYISATTAAWLTAAFTQQPTPQKIKVARHDSVAVETPAALLTAIDAVDTDWVGVAAYFRSATAAASQAALALAIESRDKIYAISSNDVSWLDAGVPAGLSAIAAYEHTAVLFDDVPTQAAELGWLVSRLVWDPDVTSAGWEGQVRGQAALTTGLTSAQRAFIEANHANVGLPFSSAPYYVSPGVNMNNRGVYEILTGIWFKTRLSEDLAYLKLSHTARGEKIVVDKTGQAKVLAILNQRLAQGETAHHFVQGQTRATAYDITDADIAAKRLRFKVEAQIAGDARLFDVTVYLQSGALQAA